MHEVAVTRSSDCSIERAIWLTLRSSATNAEKKSRWCQISEILMFLPVPCRVGVD